MGKFSGFDFSDCIIRDYHQPASIYNDSEVFDKFTIYDNFQVLISKQ